MKSRLLTVSGAQRLGVAGAFSVLSVTASPAHAQNSSTTQAPETQPVIIVTGSRSAELLQQAPIGASVITAAQIERSGASDVNEAIRRLAGVVGRQDLSGGRDYTLDLRGFGETATQNLVVLVDGVRISENELAGARLAAIPLQLVDRIEIVRGGASVLWGEGATGGVINIVLKRPADSAAAGSVSLRAGSFAERQARAQFAAGSQDLRIDAAVQGIRSKGYRANSALRNESANIGLSARVAAARVNVRHQTESQGTRFPGALSFAQFEADPQQTRTPDDYGQLNDSRTSLAIDLPVGDFMLGFDGAWRDRSSQGVFQTSFGPYVSASQAQASQASPRLEYRGSWSGVNLRAVAGVDFQRWQYQSAPTFSGFATANERATQSTRGTYLKLDFTLPTQTRVALGTRKETADKSTLDSLNQLSYEQSRKLDAWEAGISQTLTQGLDAYLRSSKSYRIANVDENRRSDFSVFPAVQLPPLEPQTGRDDELGIKLSGAQWQGALRVFRQRTKNEIGFDPVQFLNVNGPPAERKGAEAELRWRVVPALEIAATAQALRAQVLQGPNAGKELPLVPRRSATLRASYSITPSQMVELGVQHLAEQRFGDDQDNTCTRRIPAATTLDARYAYTRGPWVFSLQGSNLSDRNYYTYAFSCANGALYPESGRAVQAGVTYRF
jgi:iron complex outermembrane receptor protein